MHYDSMSLAALIAHAHAVGCTPRDGTTHAELAQALAFRDAIAFRRKPRHTSHKVGGRAVDDQGVAVAASRASRPSRVTTRMQLRAMGTPATHLRRVAQTLSTVRYYTA